MKKLIILLLYFLFLSSIHGQKVLNLCSDSIKVNQCENLDQLVRACNNHYEYLDKLDSAALYSKSAIDIQLYNIIPKSNVNIKFLKEEITRVDEKNFRSILDLCDKIYQENYIARTWDKKNEYGVSLKTIIDEVKRLIEKQDWKEQSGNDENEEIEDNKNDVEVTTPTTPIITADQKSKVEESIGNNHKRTKGNKLNRNQWYLLSFLCGLLFAGLIYFFHFKTSNDEIINGLEVGKKIAEENLKVLQEELEKYKKENTTLRTEKNTYKTNSENNQARIKFLEGQFKNLKTQNQSTGNQSDLDYSESTGNQTRTVVWDQSQSKKPDILYHHDVEADNKSLKIKKSTTGIESYSTYRLEVEGNEMELSIMPEQKVTKMLLGFIKNKVESLFEIPYRPGPDVKLFYTKRPAKFEKSQDGEYWVLIKRGQLEFR